MTTFRKAMIVSARFCGHGVQAADITGQVVLDILDKVEFEGHDESLKDNVLHSIENALGRLGLDISEFHKLAKKAGV